jgi:hypothetical protein
MADSFRLLVEGQAIQNVDIGTSDWEDDEVWVEVTATVAQGVDPNSDAVKRELLAAAEEAVQRRMYDEDRDPTVDYDAGSFRGKFPTIYPYKERHNFDTVKYQEDLGDGRHWWYVSTTWEETWNRSAEADY